jgi:hypothetical protein
MSSAHKTEPLNSVARDLIKIDRRIAKLAASISKNAAFVPAGWPLHYPPVPHVVSRAEQVQSWLLAIRRRDTPQQGALVHPVAP